MATGYCLAVLASFFLLGSAQAQGIVLTRLDQAQLDSLVSHTAQTIKEAPLEEKHRSVLVMDFFRNAPGTSSRLGTLLADTFSEALAAHTTGFKVLDRRILGEYLRQNWTRLENFQTNAACFQVARQLGATGVIVGTVQEENGHLYITLHLEGFGPPAEGKDIFESTDERIRFSLTDEMHELDFQPGPDYSRSPDEIPDEPGILRAGMNGAGTPSCIYCPQPEYSAAARAAKFQGNVVLSIVVTAEGQATSIYVAKGAPFGLVAQAIETTRHWRFEPAHKDGKPVAVRVEIETTFHLY
jgi:TonB family protein